MIGALGSTCDPTVLVSGSPAALRGDADELEARAGALEDAAVDVEHRIVEAWIGDAADAYAARRQTLTEGLRGVAQVYAIAVAVLRVHADRLEWGQGRAQTAIDLWDRGCAATTSAPRRIGAPTLGVRASQRPLGTSAVAIMTRPSVADPVPDPIAGAATKVRAEQILTGARNEVTASAHAAQEILDELSAGLPDGRWHADQFLGGLGDWVTGIAGLVATFNAYRAFVDPVGYATDAREMAAAMYAIPGQLVDDPVGTAETLLDVRTLRDNPGRWWGRMAPDIAMSVATAGVGLAAKSGRLGVAATRVVDEVADAATTGRTADRLSDAAAAARRADAALSDAGLRTMPSRLPDPDAVPGGRPARISPRLLPDTVRSLTRENESAVTLARHGYSVEQNPVVPGAKKPDYRIEGRIFDNYAPVTNRVRNLWERVGDKVIAEQTQRVVLNLDDSPVSIEALRVQATSYPIDRLLEVLVIRGGEVTRLLP